jgi:DNA-binding IclR family transcriptional regulator
MARSPQHSPPRGKDSEDKSQRAVQSVEVGGRLLLCLADSAAALSLKELAAGAGGAPPRRPNQDAVSYARLGLIAQDEAGHYDLGPAALRMGLAGLQRLEPMRVAEPALRALAAQTGHAVALAVWGNFGPTVVRLIESSQPLHVSLRLGSVLSVFDTATGRAFAAQLPPERLRQALAGPLGEPLGKAAWKRREPELQSIAQEARERGLSRAVGSPIPGVNAFSAPVFDLQGQAVLVITVTDRADRLPSDWDCASATALTACARALTQRLGG